MITFIPSWNLKTNGEVRDDLIGVIRSFMESNIEHRIIILDYIPELRYFLHQYGLLETQHINLFDNLQGFNKVDQYFLTLEELNFPKEVHYVYTPFHILVYKGELLSGKIFLGSGCQVSEVHHFEYGNLSEIEIYDDRGMLSSCKKFDQGNLSYTKYLDLKGNWIFRQLSSSEILVNAHNRRGLIKDKYTNIQELIVELLNNQLQNGDNSDGIIFSLTDKNYMYLDSSCFSDNTILSIYGNRFTKFDKLEHLVSFSNSVLLDSFARIEQISPYLSKDKITKLHVFSNYDTRFTLSRTQEINEEILFVELKKISEEETVTTLTKIMDFLISILTLPQNEREFKVIFHVGSEKQKEDILIVMERLYLEKFGREIIDLNFDDSNGENDLDSSFLSLLPEEYILLKQLKDIFEFKINLHDNQLFEILHDSRLIIDLSLTPNLFIQMAGISSGLPQINRVKTEYIDEGKNGIILENIGQLTTALSYYLNSLKHWQYARGYEVKKIKEYSAVALTKRLITLLRNRGI